MKIGPADPEILRLRANKSATTQNWLPWQCPLRNWKKWTGLTTFTQIPSIWWKNRENWSSRCWDSFAQFKKRKKLTQAKYIARLTGLPSGLKKRSKNFLGRRYRPHPWWAKSHAPRRLKLHAYSVSSPLKLNPGFAPAWYCEIVEFQYSQSIVVLPNTTSYNQLPRHLGVYSYRSCY